MQLTVLTYNIRHGRGLDNVVDINRILDVIDLSGADIICLQEVDRGLPRSHFQDQSDYLARSLHFSHVFHANFGILNAGMGNAILSRFALYSTWNKALPFVGEPRGLLRAIVTTPVGPVQIFSTHWGLTNDQRQKQGTVCAETVSDCDDPTILCGDLNAVSASNEVKTLLHEADLVDSGPAEQYTFSSALPVAKIDYVLVSKEIKILEANVLTSAASDHFPLATTLELM
jgi:endonuclease/exonuclease/phosphatase family metal-dependent hydrolase